MNDQRTYKQRIERRAPLSTFPVPRPIFGVLIEGDTITAPDGWKIQSVSSSNNDWVTAIIKKGRRRIEGHVVSDKGDYGVDTDRLAIRKWTEPLVSRRGIRATVIGLFASAVFTALLSLLIDWWLSL